MDIYSIPEAFESRVRLAILSSLLNGPKNFNEIKEITKATDGNLSIHLMKLEKMQYIVSKKEFIGRKPRTTYAVTEYGRNALQEYISLLEDILRKNS